MLYRGARCRGKSCGLCLLTLCAWGANRNTKTPSCGERQNVIRQLANNTLRLRG